MPVKMTRERDGCTGRVAAVPFGCRRVGVGVDWNVDVGAVEEDDGEGAMLDDETVDDGARVGRDERRELSPSE